MTPILAFAALVLASATSAFPFGFPDCVNGPLSNNTVCDTTADPLDRATALISLFTTEEKLNNTGSVSPGVPRLGLPPYQWWQEALHGVALSPGVNFSTSGNYSYATSFPQPILLGAAFDDALVNSVATIISIEARAFNNDGRAGLDFWTPNINPFKDPRWGRGQDAVNGRPTCADPYLLQTILREHWGWTNEQQWVTSDCDSIQNIYLPHEYAATRPQAVADALNAGTDVNCGTYYQTHLPAALEQGLINITTLDRALIRQYSSLIRLGYFDPPDVQPYRALNFGDVNTPQAQQLAYQAAVEGITLLKNDGTLPLSITPETSIAMIGDWANATTQMQGNYHGIAPYLRSPLWAAQQLNVTVNYAAGDSSPGNPTTNNNLHVFAAVNKSDIIIFASGIDNSVEAEDRDRHSIAWTGNQLDLIGELAAYGKPMIVLQMGGGQLDSSPIANNPNVSALLWGGYPGQDGGLAIMDILTGKKAPAGRLPQTQYPADYNAQVPMTNMSLRPGLNNPGRTYKWYTGKPIFDFGYGLHYTNFSASINPLEATTFNISSLVAGCKERYMDRCPFRSLSVNVTNTGETTTSDYSALGFLTGSFGPRPYPKKSLVAYQRLFDISPGATATAMLNLTLGSLSRVDEMGNRILYPGDYAMMIDTQPLAMLNFTLVGEPAMLDKWPQPPPRVPQNNTGNYFVGGFDGTEQSVVYS
ncbi:hypothetical protein H2199_003254 [Coniosporium tulheliwenetii]|uniref:Uncharacterized protein n=1 Tax=Coniosporium tulheliwenetii TaxID=3383036 RepID=A0ACC2ZD78_9PEZI|nr:hypothetical protein H2199_003254 [Cladosporium sp. JES 115]